MNASKSTDWYSHWTKEYNDLCNSRWKETRDRMAAKFKDADDYILKDYMIPTLRFYKDIDKRMDYLHDFVKKNYDKDKDKFHKVMLMNRDMHIAKQFFNFDIAVRSYEILRTQTVLSVLGGKILLQRPAFCRKGGALQFIQRREAGF